MTKLVALGVLMIVGCAGDSRPAAGADTWSEVLAGHPSLTLVHEYGATGEWVTVVDDRHTELCMFSIEPGDALSASHIATLCEWRTVEEPR